MNPILRDLRDMTHQDFLDVIIRRYQLVYGVGRNEAIKSLRSDLQSKKV
jgi:hypothetical protein